ncbi:PEPxxWA-CTERM sorting domain-containing protein [Sphingomonas antarctica]|uniref:PEPxxWA-CTERM sorting domain-containing protein n=1 Tax=Sphingomonas antarctica TaxID=2040274 RepID=UPI0039E86A36
MITTRRLSRVFAVALATTAIPAIAAPCGSGVTFGAQFAGLYSCATLGTPATVPANLGGLTFLNANTLLVGGAANGGSGAIYSIGVSRDSGGHINGYSGASSLFATAPNIDGGLAFGPSGVLFATTYSDNMLLQYLPGSTGPDRAINLSSIGITASTGTLQFVPTGFGGAGSFKITSYSAGGFYDVGLIADGSTGLFNLGPATLTAQVGRGPEGIAYVGGNNAGFGVNSLLLSEYSTNSIGSYTVDASGNPLVSSRVDFLTGLGGAEGAIIDPVTGDFLFSTYGGGNQIVVISGFDAPMMPGVPEPASWALMVGGFGLMGGAIRRRQRVNVTFA